MRSRCHVLAVVFLLALAGCRDGDSTLQTRVEQRLASDLADETFTVSVDDRVVRLTGVVGSEAERIRIENAVRHVRGVLAVRNELVIGEPVTPTSATSDAHRALAASLEAQLAAAGYDALRVAVTDGTVRIAGAVAPDEHSKAVDIVRKAAPAYRIEDETTAGTP